MTETELSKSDRDLIGRMDAAFTAIDRLLMRLAQQGLQRTTRASCAELQALAQTAHNARLIFIERELDALATHLTRYLDRDPLFNVATYMATLNRIWLLNTIAHRTRQQGALPDEMVELTGEPRRTYQPIDQPLVVQPIGAAGWVTDTDFVGVTIYFFCEQFPDLLEATSTRPTLYFGHDPRPLLHHDVLEHQALKLADLIHGAFTFSGARLSHDGRLSLHKGLTIEPAPWSGARAYERLAAHHWLQLVDRLRQRQAHPILSRGDLHAYIEPATLGPLTLDQKAQRATMTALDGQGASLTLEVPLRAENNFLIDNLERIATAANTEPRTKRDRRSKLIPDGWFGRVAASDGQLKFFPITAVYHEPRQLKRRGDRDFHELHLTLESLDEIRA